MRVAETEHIIHLQFHYSLKWTHYADTVFEHVYELLKSDCFLSDKCVYCHLYNVNAMLLINVKGILEKKQRKQ